MQRNRINLVGGNAILREFKEVTQVRFAEGFGCFDMNGVVNTLRCQDEAQRTGVALDHVEDACCFILSYGHVHRRDAVFPRQHEPWASFINEMDGLMFTDFRDGQRNERRDRWMYKQHVYREPWMPPQAIGIHGCKGHVPWLFGKNTRENMPILLFDDQPANLAEVQNRDRLSGGTLVDRKRRQPDAILRQLWVEDNPARWAGWLERFVRANNGNNSILLL